MSDELIAIVGASCRFPGASDLEAFWQLLLSGSDAVSEVDSQRWSTRFYYHPNQAEPGKSYTWSAGLLSGVDLFEPAFFGISPREAAHTACSGAPSRCSAISKTRVTRHAGSEALVEFGGRAR